MLTYKANAVRQFMKRLQEISEAWETKEDGQPDLWYRGLQKSSWLLVPKLYRPSEPAKKLLQTEDEIREEFARRAPSLTDHIDLRMRGNGTSSCSTTAHPRACSTGRRTR